MKLYICGNGFDLHHRLPTGYGDYRKFLKKYHPDILKEYDHFPYLTETNELDRWADVEAALCIDYETLFYESVHENYPDLSNESDSRWYDIDINVDTLTCFVNDFTGRCFFKWISLAEQNEATADLNLDKEALFLSFNYTNTLQRIYNIPDDSILHIHGALKNLNESEILWQDALPHFSTVEEAEIQAPLAEGDTWSNGYIRGEIQFGATGITAEQVKNELTRQYQTDDFFGASIEPALNKLVDFVCKTTKNTKNNYDCLRDFIEGKNIEEVIIMGVSLGDADDAYFADILVPILKNASWIFMFHKESDKDHTKIERFIRRHKLENTDIKEW